MYDLSNVADDCILIGDQFSKCRMECTRIVNFAGKWLFEGVRDPTFGVNMCLDEDKPFDHKKSRENEVYEETCSYDSLASTCHSKASGMGNSCSRAVSAWTARPMAPMVAQTTSCIGDDTTQCKYFSDDTRHFIRNVSFIL